MTRVRLVRRYRESRFSSHVGQLPRGLCSASAIPAIPRITRQLLASPVSCPLPNLLPPLAFIAANGLGPIGARSPNSPPLLGRNRRSGPMAIRLLSAMYLGRLSPDWDVGYRPRLGRDWPRSPLRCATLRPPPPNGGILEKGILGKGETCSQGGPPCWRKLQPQSEVATYAEASAACRR